ncbi:MAG TPA: STAS domain-containing protein [Candidatus Cybelea sp.]|jgi:anti-anti-sigma factor
MTTAREPATSEVQRTFLIKLVGEFDLSERERLKDVFAIANSAQLVVINLQQTDYLDSSVLQCFVDLHKAALETGAHIVFVGVHGAVRRVLELTAMETLFDIRPTMREVGLDGNLLRELTVEAGTV